MRTTQRILTTVFAVAVLSSVLPAMAAAQGMETIGCGEVVSGELEQTTEQDWFQFQGSEGDVISLVVWETSGSNLDVVADLFGPGPSVDPVFEGLRGPNVIELPATGLYTARVHDDSFFYTGSYSMELEWLYPLSSRCSAVPLDCGRTQTGQIGATSQHDLFGFTGSAGDVVSLVVWETSGSNLDITADLYGPSIGPVPVATGLRGEANLVLPETGPYTLVVHDDSFYYGGSYSMELEWLYPLSSQCSTEPLLCGAVTERAIEHTSQQDLFVFEGVAGDVAVITLWEISGSNLDIEADLYGPSSDSLMTPDLRGENRVMLSETGTYTLRVHDDSFYYGGRYSLSFFFLGKPCPCSVDDGRIPGDCNQDCRIDLSDAVCLFNALFLGQVSSGFACGNVVLDDGRALLLDWQGDGSVDLSDGVALLNFLFLKGPSHVLGTEPVEVAGCE